MDLIARKPVAAERWHGEHSRELLLVRRGPHFTLEAWATSFDHDGDKQLDVYDLATFVAAEDAIAAFRSAQ